MLAFVIKIIKSFRFSGRTLFSGPQTFFMLNSRGKLSKIRFLGYLLVFLDLFSQSPMWSTEI